MRSLQNDHRDISIAIADDHPIFRNGLLSSLNVHIKLQLVLEASNGNELLEGLIYLKSIPDVVILDINMPVMNGYDTIEELSKRWPEVKVIALSMFDNEFAVIKMLKSGAKSYINKQSTTTELSNALNWVHKYGYYYSELANMHLFDKIKKNRTLDFSEKELLFLAYCCSMYSFAEIAKKMYVSVSSIEKYQASIKEKTGIHSRCGLAMFAKDIGLVSINQSKA